MRKRRRVLICETPQGGGSLVRSIELGRAFRDQFPATDVFFAVASHQAAVVADQGLVVVRRLTTDPLLHRSLTLRERSRRRLTLSLLNAGQVLAVTMRLRPSLLVLDGIPVLGALSRFSRGRIVVLVDPHTELFHPSAPYSSFRFHRFLDQNGLGRADRSVFLGTPRQIPEGQLRNWATQRLHFAGNFDPTQSGDSGGHEVQEHLIAVVQEESSPVPWLHRAAVAAYREILAACPSARMALAGVKGLEAILTPEHPRPVPVSRTSWVDLATVVSLAHVPVLEATSPLTLSTSRTRPPLRVHCPDDLGGFAHDLPRSTVRAPTLPLLQRTLALEIGRRLVHRSPSPQAEVGANRAFGIDARQLVQELVK